jgi:hypothetical protein
MQRYDEAAADVNPGCMERLLFAGELEIGMVADVSPREIDLRGQRGQVQIKMVVSTRTDWM